MEKARILIVEDEAIIAMEVESQLQGLGYNVTSIVDTGVKAIKKAEEDKPDIILMDIRIKGEMDGIEAAEEIRNRFGIPVIFSTAYLDEDRIERAKITMPFGYVLKPIQERDLRVTIEMALNVMKVDKERKQVEEQLSNSHLVQKALIENIADVIAIVDQTGINRYKSPNIEKWFGWKPEELIGEDTWKNVHPDDVYRIQSVFGELLHNDNFVVTEEYRYLCKDGTYKWIHTSATNRITDKNINGILLNYHDITDRKKTEHELITSKEKTEESEMKYRLLLTNTLETVWSTDIEFNLTYVNNAIYDFLGYTSEEFIGLNPSVFTPPEGMKAIQKSAELLMASYQAGEIIQDKLEQQQIKKDGTIIDVEISTNILFNDEGQIIGFQGRSIDITVRKQTEKALKESELFFSQIFEQSTTSTCLYNPEGTVIRVNSEFCKMFGVEEELITGGKYNVFEDQAAKNAGIIPLLKEIFEEKKTNKWEFSFNLDVSSKSTGTGTTREGEVYLEVFGYPIVDGENHLKYVVLKHYDITKRKQMEESLRKLSNAVEQSPASVVITDLSGAIEYVNPKFEHLTGYSMEEATGKNPSILKSGEQLDNVYEELWQTITTGGVWHGNFQNKKKNGELYWESATISPIKDGEGKIINYLAVKEDITERKLAEDAVKKERDFATAILRWIESIVVVIDLDGYVITFNKAAERCSGYMFEEIRHNPFWEVLISLEERNSVKEVILNVKTKALPIENENKWVTKDGQERLIHWFNSVLKGVDGNVEYILCTGLDLTERIQIETALQRTTDHYQSVLENMQEGYFEIDLAGNFTAVNQSLVDTLGYPKAELIGMNNREFMDKENAKKVVKIFNDVFLSGKPQNYLSYEVIHKGGEARAVEVSTSLLYDSAGKPIGFFGISRDATDRNRMEAMMIQSEKMMSLGGLAAGMAHELNNPLGGILQGVQNVQRRLSSDLKKNQQISDETGVNLQKLQSYLEKRGIISLLNGIQSSGKRASQIISNMLRFSRKSESKMAPTDLAALIENVLDLASKEYNPKKQFDFRSITVVKEFDANLPVVPCTETEIEQVILNLLSNAAWAMAKDENNKSPQINLRLKLEDESARIEVADNGPGIDEETRKRIFEPFFTTKPVGEGTGLGLSVSYMIITNNHNGTMEVESKIGVGTKFIIQLPSQ